MKYCFLFLAFTTIIFVGCRSSFESRCNNAMDEIDKQIIIVNPEPCYESEITSEEYKIYSLVIDSLILVKKYNCTSVIISNHTIGCSINPEHGNRVIDSLVLKSLIDKRNKSREKNICISLDSIKLNHFKKINIDLEKFTQLVRNKEYQKLSFWGVSLAWDGLFLKYPHVAGILDLSRVIIDDTGQNAIMYLELNRGYSSCNLYIYLHKKEGKWNYICYDEISEII